MNRFVQSLLVLAAAGCGITDADRLSLRVEGTVTALETGQPVAGASVQLIDIAQSVAGSGDVVATASTDAQGRYSLTYSSNENCFAAFLLGAAISASATAFTTGTASVDPCTTTLQRVDFALEP